MVLDWVPVICPMFNEPCKYCTEVFRQTGQFTKVEKDPVTHLFKPLGRGSKKLFVGYRCENHGNAMVSELKYCPHRWALHGTGKVGSLTKSI